MTTRHFAKNTRGRDFVVGDIHGCYDELQMLLTTAEFDTACDRVFAVGDLVDRGPESAAVVLLLEEPWFWSVLGNHELMLLESYADYRNTGYWQQNGGGWWLGEARTTQQQLASLVSDLPLAIVVGDGAQRFNVLHAEFFGSDAALDAGAFSGAQVNSLLWGRDLASGARRGRPLPESPTYVGHTIVAEVTAVDSVRYIDTGAFLTAVNDPPVCGRLTLIEPATGLAWQSAFASCLPARWVGQFPGLQPSAVAP